VTGEHDNDPGSASGAATLIVLNNDATVCEACYEPQALELDPGLIPWARIASGECSRCGADPASPPAVERPGRSPAS
jgi:hypothetical protein